MKEWLTAPEMEERLSEVTSAEKWASATFNLYSAPNACREARRTDEVSANRAGDISPPQGEQRLSAVSGRENGEGGFRIHGREAYWWRGKKPGTSLFSNVPFPKVLREPFTIRSTNTIRKQVA